MPSAPRLLAFWNASTAALTLKQLCVALAAHGGSYGLSNLHGNAWHFLIRQTQLTRLCRGYVIRFLQSEDPDRQQGQRHDERQESRRQTLVGRLFHGQYPPFRKLI